MNNCVFTICAKNYIGLAKILESSIKEHTPDVSFYIFIADEMTEGVSFPDNVIEAKQVLRGIIGEDKWDEMAFKYNLIEFCTAIKPFCFKYFFEYLNVKKAIYFDPDILTFSSLDPILSELNTFSAIVTPHITTISLGNSGDFEERELLGSGIFNLGFLALSYNLKVSKMLSWWGERLKNECFLDVFDSTYTDQKWMDLLPCFFGDKEIKISNHLGLNVAPWNFHERELYLDNAKWHVKLRRDAVDLDIYGDSNQSYPLVFVHYSGYDYRSLLSGDILQRGEIRILKPYNDVIAICDCYSEFLKIHKELFNSFIGLSYTYNFYENGESITQFHRRLFRNLADSEQVHTPFSVKQDSFYSRLRDKNIITNKKDNGASIDKANKFNVPGLNKKLKMINWGMRCVFKLVGVGNYILLLRLMRPYSRAENHIHLIDKKYGNKLK